MKKVTIDLDYKRTPPTQEQLDRGDKVLSSPELTYDYVSYAINNTYKDGLEGSLRRVWGRVQRKFDAAIDQKTGFVELEEAEWDLVNKAFASVKFHPGIAKFVMVLEEELERALKQGT